MTIHCFIILLLQIQSIVPIQTMDDAGEGARRGGRMGAQGRAERCRHQRPPQDGQMGRAWQAPGTNLGPTQQQGKTSPLSSPFHICMCIKGESNAQAHVILLTYFWGWQKWILQPKTELERLLTLLRATRLRDACSSEGFGCGLCVMGRF